MNGRLTFDVYAKITDPLCRVTHEAHDNHVSVVVGGTQSEIPVNLLQLWFKEPDTVIRLGRDLISAGMQLAAQRANSLPGSAQSSQKTIDSPERLDHAAHARSVKLVRLQEGVFATGATTEDGHSLPRVVHAVDSSVDLSASDGVTALCGAHFAPNSLVDVSHASAVAHRLCLRHLPTSPSSSTVLSTGSA